MKFRKKPVVIEAMQLPFDECASEELLNFLGGMEPDWFSERGGRLSIHTFEGIMVAEPGDWIIREPFPTGDRRYYPCKPDIFEQTYERVV